jgi:hypothetical protein
MVIDRGLTVGFSLIRIMWTQTKILRRGGGFVLSVKSVLIIHVIPDQKSTPIAKYHMGLFLKKPFISQAASTLIK